MAPWAPSSLPGGGSLAEIRVDERYKQAMTFVKIMSVLAVLNTVRAHFVFNMPTLFTLLLTIYGLVTLAAIVVFCIAMRWFCEVAWLPEAARSWQTTTVASISLPYPLRRNPVE